MTGNLFPARLRVSHQNRTLNTNYRRNGKLQSCEPCRKGKLRCDHMMPTCGRCARRGKPEQCIYHPAPLTKSAIPTPSTDNESTSPTVIVQSSESTTASGSTWVTRPRTEGNPFTQSRQSRASSLPAQPWSSLNYGQQTVEELRRPLPEAHVRGDSILRHPSAGFMHHSAILAENEVSIGIVPTDADPAPTSQVPQSYVEKGAAVLTLLKDYTMLQRYIDKWFSFARGIVLIEPMVKIFTTGLWSKFGRYLKDQNANDLRRLSELTWQNTLKPLSPRLNRHTTPREFCASVTGDNLRWEVVGIIVTLVCLVAESLSDGDPIFCSHEDPPVDRKALVLKTHNASEICLSFCDDFGILNDLYLWFLFENTIVYCSMRTKGSYENWKKSGILFTALTYCNIHEEIKVDDHTPFFITEMRKRLFVCAYENDKYTATYNGRPPRITRHYCKLQLPLDLSDAQIMSDGLDLESALTSLDVNGWNQRGVVQRCTFARIFMTNALITEEILEISMGSMAQEEIVRRAVDIEQRAVQLWNDLPDFLRMDDQPFVELKRTPFELLVLVYIRLDDLFRHFLLQRTLIKKVGADSSKLLAISKEIFQFMLQVINYREVFKDFQVDFVQLLTMNGIPSAAVIAVELLHQEQDPSSPSALTNPLPRSDTIQQLSVFVACLGTIQPWSNGYMSCDRGRKFLKKILDTILDPAPSRQVSNQSIADGLGDDPSLTSPLFQTGSDGDFMRWLESMEWEQDAWMNFN